MEHQRIHRDQQLASLSQCAVNGQIVHKIDLIAIIRVCGVHYFNVYRRYNSVYEIVIEDSRSDMFLQTNGSVRTSLQQVLCLSQQDGFRMYSQDLYSFRHGGVPPTSSPAFENMTWSQVQDQWACVDVNLRGVLEEYHAFVRQFYQEQQEQDEDEDDDDDDEDHDDENGSVKMEEEDEEDYSDMPELIDDSDEEDTDAVEEEEEEEEDVSSVSDASEEKMTNPIVYPRKRTFLDYESGSECGSGSDCCSECCSGSECSSDSGSESGSQTSCAESETSKTSCAESHTSEKNYTILRNGVKYRKVCSF